MSIPTLAALARAVYELSSDLRAFGPQADAVLAGMGGTETQAQALLAHVHYLRQQLAAARPAWLAAQRERLGLDPAARGLKLHVGCGGHALPGWVNLDVHPAPLCWNVHWGLPFADGAATHVFVSHLFEHLFFPHDAMAFLAELKRVLAHGGRVRIVVPDVAQLVDAYQRGDREFFAKRAAHWTNARGDGPLLAQFLNYAGAGPDPGYLFEAHKFGYDFDTLAALLREAGFESIVRNGFMQSDDPSLRLDDQSAVAGAEHGGGHYSLFVEAVAPAPVTAVAVNAPPTPIVDAEALRQRAQVAIAKSRLPEAESALAEARDADPADAQTARRHGVALMALRRFDESEAAFRDAIRLDARMPAAHLQLGRLLESTGRVREAVGAYFRALTIAQSREQWLDEASTPPGLRADVLHAMAMVREQRVPVLMGLMEPLEARFGREAITRVRAGLAHWLGAESHPPIDARQAPRFLHIPDLPSPPWFDPAVVPWLPQLEAAFPAMREEALAVLAAREGVQPFLAATDSASLEPYLGGGAEARWDAFFFYRDGTHHAANAVQAPRTSAVLENLPLVRIREHAPEICFSILAPGTHIKPHHGVTNARIVVHLPLVVPEGCTLTVGGDERQWCEGRAWAFDDTFLHEARNASGETRVILLMDAWNPHLTEAERVAVTEIVEGIGAFNRG
ncbi:MAG: aspartyl/asparaginyl beta-hydroxylase domain-containing protein [Silanimonas sp.]